MLDILAPIKTKPAGLDSDPLGPATPDIAIVRVLDFAWLHKPANISLTVSELTAPKKFIVLLLTFDVPNCLGHALGLFVVSDIPLL